MRKYKKARESRISKERLEEVKNGYIEFFKNLDIETSRELTEMLYASRETSYEARFNNEEEKMTKLYKNSCNITSNVLKKVKENTN